MYDNHIYRIFNQNSIQEQLKQQIQQHQNDQIWKSIECANKLDDFLKIIHKVEPEYQQFAFEQCCFLIGKHMKQQRNL